MKLKQLLENLDYSEVIGTIDITISNIQFDSRKIEDGDVFVAVRGTESDGHEFIESAVSFGAKVVVCEESPKIHYDNVTLIIVDKARKALARISANYYGNPSSELRIVGVTGTNGKTTVTFLISELLRKLGHKTAIIGTTGIYIGEEKLDATHTTPDPISMNKVLREVVEKGIGYVVMEVSSHALEQNRADYIDFDLAIFTNITHDHLDYHRTFEAYSEAKKLLFDNLKSTAFAIVNVDDAGYKIMISDTVAIVSKVGWDTDADYQIMDEEFDHTGSRFTIEEGEVKHKIHSPLVAQFNIVNLSLSLVAVSKLCNVELSSLINDLSYISSAPGRMERIPLSNGAIAIIDYAHTPDALEKAGKACKELIVDDARLITVFGCGGDRDKTKRPLMAAAAEKHADRIIVTDDNPRTEARDKIFADIEKGLTKPGSYLIIRDREEAIKEAVRISNSGDIILIAGKGHEDYQIIGTQKVHFNDKEVVLSVRL
ncbi:MAG: UDP-N-acetylmuramoyl-L-alanyl-D-glutamate--2,6-diaminopimelate ligase [Ignavibacteriae bacterium HGW-Ignavibacteriae-4]|nr:MAG: UDP-N-acetylmuramoyl-L-alanyl-D-glutamate--2,6-diaminopimelate ligase [Ignavibacteriae bacterium HGW-Ignavibacteriae-4]